MSVTTSNVGSASAGSKMSGSSASSSPPADFEAFYHSVCSDLQNKGEVHSMSKLFAQLTTDEERMRFVLERNFAANLWWRDFNFALKDRGESQRLRNLGNQVYQKNKLAEALEYYSLSICYAPHPPPPNSFLLHGGPGGGNSNDLSSDDSGFTHEELALGYANRSAVLFQMKEYDLCIRDITRAFDHSYPNNLMYKLFERKSRCLKALKDFPRSLEAMKSAEMWMKYSTLSETKSSGFKKEIAKQVDFLEEKVAGMNINEFAESAEMKKSLVAPVKVVELPRMKKEESKEIPGVRRDVKLAYAEDKGRHLIATEDILPGEIVITESPYSSILLPEYYNTHCQTCYHRIIATIPCWLCAKVRFCSDECRSEAWERFHKVECQQLNLILDAGVGKNAMLSMRILTSSGKIYLEYVINKLREEADSRKGRADASRMLGFNEDGIYDPADYRAIHSLIANSKHRGVGDLFKRSLMALYLLRVLEMTPFFYNGGSDPRNVAVKDKVMMGAVVLKHLQNLPCNAHELSEMELPPASSTSSSSSGLNTSSTNGNNALSTSRDCVTHEIGAAVFGVLSLLNHSCNPNVVRHYYSQNSAVRAIRTIRKGEELLDNYGYHYAVMPKEERQRKLHNQYYFHCGCTACSKSWPLYPSITTTPLPLSSIPVPEHKAVLAELAKRSKSYKRSFDLVLSGGFGEALPVLLDHLAYLDSHVCRPLREYNDCQEAIKQCYSAIANSYRAKGPSGSSSGGGGGGGGGGKKDRDVIV